MSRRLPVYLLLDTSGSMRGERIESVKVGMQALVANLRQDPHALESVHLSVISFDRDARVLCPLTALEDFQPPVLDCPETGATHLGEALKTVCQCLDNELIRGTSERKGDWRPLLMIMTDGKPSDTAEFNRWSAEIRKKGFASIIACAAGSSAKAEPLKKVADHVVELDTADGASLTGFFKWVSTTVSSGAMSMAVVPELALPPPPPEVHIVV